MEIEWQKPIHPYSLKIDRVYFSYIYSRHALLEQFDQINGGYVLYWIGVC